MRKSALLILVICFIAAAALAAGCDCGKDDAVRVATGAVRLNISQAEYDLAIKVAKKEAAEAAVAEYKRSAEYAEAIRAAADKAVEAVDQYYLVDDAQEIDGGSYAVVTALVYQGPDEKSRGDVVVLKGTALQVPDYLKDSDGDPERAVAVKKMEEILAASAKVYAATKPGDRLLVETVTVCDRCGGDSATLTAARFTALPPWPGTAFGEPIFRW